MRPSYWSELNFSEKPAAKLFATSPGAPKLGVGIKLSNFIMAALGLGNTLSRPPVEKAWRLVPSGLPVLGSNTMPARAGTRGLPGAVVGTSTSHGFGEVVPFEQM